MRKKGEQIKTVEDFWWCLQAGHMMYFGNHCFCASQFLSWPLCKIIKAVKTGMLYLPEPKLREV